MTQEKPFGGPERTAKYTRSSSQIVLDSIQGLREEYRERALVDSAQRLQDVPSYVTLDMTVDLIESVRSLRNAGEAAIVRRRR